VVYSLSRYVLSTRDTLEILGKLDKAGANLASLSEQINITSATGKMILRMLAILVEFE
jgi:DNA invertase Pin-like site-specific DNA recombinase